MCSGIGLGAVLIPKAKLEHILTAGPAQEAEEADPEHRDGLAAQLDETAHDKRVRRRNR